MSDLLILPVSATCLVFGLDWLPLISGRAGQAALKTARQHRATHLVVAGDTAAAVGFAALKLERGLRKEPLYSAAQNVARLFSTGTIALLLELDSANFWLVAVHEGAVVARTDKLYGSSSEALLRLDELRQAYPQLIMLGTEQGPESLSLPVIAAASDAQTRLVTVRRRHSLMPVPVQWFFFALVLVLLVPRLWALAHSSIAVGPPDQEADPALAWQQAMSAVTRNIMVHGVQGTDTILQDLYRLPVWLGGWALIDASCAYQSVEWRCQARYDRRNGEASNEQLLARAPPGWSIEFITIDHAQPVWRVKAVGLPLSAELLKSRAGNERYLFSSLQSIRPAFAQIKMGRPQALKISPPRDAKGQTIPKPAYLPTYLVRSVQFDGPLRSASLLLPNTGSISWNKVFISVREAEQVALKSSRITVSFQGDLYEMESVEKGEDGHGIYDSDSRIADFAEAFMPLDSMATS